MNMKIKILFLGIIFLTFFFFICSFVLGGNKMAASASVLYSAISKVSAFLY